MAGEDLVNKAFKFRIYPDEPQRMKIEKTFSCVRFVYNKMLSDKMQHYRQTGKMLRNTPAQYKKEFPWLKEVDSLALANAQLHLQSAFEHYFNQPDGTVPKFKSRKRSKKCYTTNCVYGNIQIRDGYIRLPKIGYIRMKQHRMIPKSYILKSVTVSRNISGNYFVSVLFEYPKTETQAETNRTLDIAYSEKELYIDADGVTHEYPDYLRKTLAQIEREKRKLLHMKKGSQNRKKQFVRIVRLKERFYNQRSDFLHKQSRQITNAYDCVYVRETSAEARKNLGWWLFKFYLKYKLNDAGKTFIGSDDILFSNHLIGAQAV